MRVHLKNNSGRLIQAKLGFSFTVLFFGFFVPLFRGDVKWFCLMIVLGCITFGFAQIVLSFLYNKIYVNDLLNQSYYAADEMSSNMLKSRGFIT